MTVSWHRSFPHALAAWALVSLAGCAPDIGELEETPTSDSVVVAQFDPTNPIPQLQLVPTPTALVQNGDGTLNREAITPPACELPSTAQCLLLSDGGWPTSVNPTLYFSAPLVLDSVADGILLFEVTASGLSKVEVTGTQDARADPPTACMMGNNGSTGNLTFTQDDVLAAWGSTPTDLEIVPDGGFKPGTQYILVATRALQGAAASDGGAARPVEPTDLFYLLANAEAPVDANGQISDPLLRSSVQASVLASLFPGRSVDELDAAELQTFQAAVASSGVSLYGLYTFIEASLAPLVNAGILSSRRDAVMVTTWSTDPETAATVASFDPAGTTFPTDIRFPFPNDQLLTSTTASGQTMVSFPTEGLTGALLSLASGLNTLDGFGVSTPISIPVSGDLDPSSLEGNVVMYALDAGGGPVEPAIPVAAVALAGTSSAGPQIIVQPNMPLAQATTYVVGVTNGVKDAAGNALGSSSTYSLLKSPTPIISGGSVDTNVLPALQCSTVPSTGALASDAQVVAIASQLENDLRRESWQTAFQALESLSTPIPRTQVAMAFTYTTQSVTTLLGGVRTALQGGAYDALTPANGPMVSTAIDIVDTSTTFNIANAVGLGTSLCLPLCQAGGMQSIPPAIAPASCAGDVAAVTAHPVCQLLFSAYTDTLGRARTVLSRQLVATAGHPAVSGTFTPATLMAPRVEYNPTWVLTPLGTAPAGGWPVAIFQHGLGQDRSNVFLIANTLAKAGYATVAFDMPFHGVRASDLYDATGAPCPNVDPASVTCDPTTGTCTGGCDGVQDAAGTGFLSANLFATRDNFRQATFDQLSLIRDLRMASGTGGILADLDATTIAYVGQSLGGIAGGNLAAQLAESEVDAMVLNVAGGNLVTIVEGSVPSISAGVFAALAASGVCELEEPGNPGAGCKPTPLYETFTLIAQWITEPGEPLGNSVGVPSTTIDKLLMQVATPDLVIPNLSSQLLGNAYGFDLMSMDPQYQAYDFTSAPAAGVGTGCHGFLLAPTCGACALDALCQTFGAQAQAATFLATGGMTVGPQTPDTLLGGAVNCTNPCN